MDVVIPTMAATAAPTQQIETAGVAEAFEREADRLEAKPPRDERKRSVSSLESDGFAPAPDSAPAGHPPAGTCGSTFATLFSCSQSAAALALQGPERAIGADVSLANTQATTQQATTQVRNIAVLLLGQNCLDTRACLYPSPSRKSNVCENVVRSCWLSTLGSSA